MALLWKDHVSGGRGLDALNALKDDDDRRFEERVAMLDDEMRGAKGREKTSDELLLEKALKELESNE